MNCNYKIPIIPQNLDKHETIIQISEAFQYLSDVTDALFTQLNKKMEIDGQKISSLGERINSISTKINKLKGSKTATQVFSSSKYPASNVNQDYISIFHDCPPVEYKRYPRKYKNFYSSHEPLEKLQLYHVNVSHEVQGQKLGKISLDKVNFVNDLHSTSSGKYLYKKYETNEALRNSQTIDNNISKIDEPPHSISDKASLTRSVTQDYMYAPQIGEVPALEVPLDLPDLPGVADNLHYENDLGPAIAPSAFIGSINLPTIQSTEIEEISISVNLSVPPPPPHPSNISELPQPPENFPKPPLNTHPVQTKLPKPTELPRPPTELPEPPELSDIEVSTNDKANILNPIQKDFIEDSSQPPQLDMRSSLMEAIRKAGGSGKAKLKSVAPKEEKATETKKVEVSSCIKLWSIKIKLFILIENNRPCEECLLYTEI